MVRYSLGEGKDGRPGGEGDKVTETRDEARQCGEQYDSWGQNPKGQPIATI